MTPGKPGYLYNMKQIDISNVKGRVYHSFASCKGTHNVELSVVNDLTYNETFYQVNNYNSDEELCFEFDDAGKAAAVEQFNEWIK